MLGAFASLGEQAEQHHKSLMSAVTPAKPVRRVLVGTVTAAGNGTDLITATNQSQMGPSAGRMWVLRKAVLSPVPSTTVVTGGTTSAKGTFTAGAAGNAVLPAGASITGFTISAAATAAAASGTITVSNVAGGPLTYDYVFPNAGNSPDVLNITFPRPLSPSGGAITVAINAVTGGSAGNINVYGISGGTVTADIYAGASADVIGTDFEALEALATTLPYVNTWGNRHVCLYPGETLYAIINGAAVNTQFVMVMEADEYPIEQVEAMHA